MARKPNREKSPLSNAVRIKMCRKRRKMKKARQQLLNVQLVEEEIRNGMNNESLNGPPAITPPPDLRTQLRDWANNHRITKRALDGLLSILNSNGIKSVPKNHRTLLNTPVKTNIIEIAGGLFWDNGLEKSIRQMFPTIDRDMTISLNVNVDGLPLYKSSKIQFWPILASIHGMCVCYLSIHYCCIEMITIFITKEIDCFSELSHIPPMTIAIWCGSSKPNNLNEYFGRFVDEMKFLLNQPIAINNHFIFVKLRCFICDTPARAFIKGIVGHTSHFGCQKCMAQGVYNNVQRKISFPRIAITDDERKEELRTDANFRGRYQPKHHHIRSILEDLSIDMIISFPISDALHLFDLGIMKRFVSLVQS